MDVLSFSIREDETASELSGIDVGYYKVFAFAVSAFLQDLQEDYMHIIIQLSFLKDLTSTNQLKF